MNLLLSLDAFMADVLTRSYVILFFFFFAVSPHISMPSLQESYNEGSLVNLSCTASGTPDPDVKWIRNGRMISSGKKIAFFTFSSINRADDGQYTCKGNNSAGIDENRVTLVIHCK